MHDLIHDPLRVFLANRLLLHTLRLLQQRLPPYDSCGDCPILVVDELHIVVCDGCVISKGLANIANNDLEQKFTVEVKLN